MDVVTPHLLRGRHICLVMPDLVGHLQRHPGLEQESPFCFAKKMPTKCEHENLWILLAEDDSV